MAFNRRKGAVDGGDYEGTGLQSFADLRLKQCRENEVIDSKYGFERISDQVREETGYLLNMHSTEILDDDKRLIGAIDYYFIKEDGARFKVALPYKPYFYILIKKVP